MILSTMRNCCKPTQFGMRSSWMTPTTQRLRPADLAMDRDEWSNFIDDLTEDDLQTLRLVYPAFALGQEEQLLQNADFIETPLERS